jgi:hydroxymethylpyrimidine pyrophosphatase-like HAD family hydrolase
MRRVSPDMAARTLIACGDYENDIPMLKAADIAICPANAMDEVKKICDFVLCDCDEGLIADIIEHIEAGKILSKQK